MDSHQAKQILELYRPGADDADPQFAEARALAEHDPELRRWFEERYDLYAAIHAKFSQIPVPTGLRDRILAARAIVSPVVWWRDPLVLTAAAAIAMFAAVIGFLIQSHGRTDLGGFRQSMVKAVSVEYKMMLETNDLNQIRDFLARSQAQAEYTLSPALRQTSAEGCSILNWHGHKVSLLCFDLGNDNDLWLFIVDRSALPDAPPTASPQFVNVGKMTTASWSEDNNTYLLAAVGDEEKLRKYL